MNPKQIKFLHALASDKKKGISAPLTEPQAQSDVPKMNFSSVPELPQIPKIKDPTKFGRMRSYFKK